MCARTSGCRGASFRQNPLIEKISVEIFPFKSEGQCCQVVGREDWGKWDICTLLDALAGVGKDDFSDGPECRLKKICIYYFLYF